MLVPFVVYADFERILKTVNDIQEKQNLSDSFTVKKFEHVPYSFAYYIKCAFDNSFSKFETYRGHNCAEMFINLLQGDIQQIYNTFFKTITKINVNFN